MAESPWFYLDRDQQTIGPLSFRDMDVLLRTNEIELSTYAWTESMSSWQHVGQIPEFIQSIADFDIEVALHTKPTEIASIALTESEKKDQELQKAKQKRQQAKHKKQKLKKLKKWYKPKHNTNLYISGLPKTISIETLKELFTKAGMIRLDKFTGSPKIKIYTDDSGKPKGDALVSYMNSESLAMAITMLNKQEIEKGYTIHLEPAEFVQKGDYIARKKVEVNKIALIQAKAKREELTGWTDEAKGLRIVIVEGLFKPDTYDDGIEERLKGFIEQTIGEVHRVKVFRFNPDGVAEIKFMKSVDAAKCVEKLNESEVLGKVVKCFYWDGKTDFRRVTDIQVQENEEEQEQRIKEFGEWLEGSDSEDI